MIFLFASTDPADLGTSSDPTHHQHQLQTIFTKFTMLRTFNSRVLTRGLSSMRSARPSPPLRVTASIKPIKSFYRMLSSQYLADTGAPICKLEATSHFDILSNKEKLYAHHMSRAAHHGTRIVLRQVSPESEDIYDLILTLHIAVQGDWSQYTKSRAINEQDLTLFLEYAAQVLANLGNYKSFGDTKFVPRVSKEVVEKMVNSAPETLDLWEKVKDAMWNTEDERKTLLGFESEGHTTTYYGGGVNKEVIEAVQEVLSKEGIMAEKSRLFKTGDGEYEFRIASAMDTGKEATYEIPGGLGKVKLVYGDHSAEMAKIVKSLESAKAYAGNKTQTAMIEAYIDSFKTGSMTAHKLSQSLWVKDIAPSVETNIGFIETYRDPAGIRGEWEGLVAMVNEERTKKFGALVSAAQHYIDLLPWPKAFEKDTFTAPDFTSLEVLTFAGSGVPAGINIPNYDDVRLSIGFKNVSLGNVLSAKGTDEKVTFLGDEDAALYEKYHAPAFEMQVGIHELLGHGTGKLLSENADGTFNFDTAPVSPITGKPVTTYYKSGETWGSKFGAIAASYEEARAETVAMYLACDASLLEIFGHKGQEASDVLYAAYLQMARAGLLALEFWDPASKKWGQAHMQARYSILQAFLRAPAAPNGEKFVELAYEQPDFSDLTLKLNASLIQTIGKDSMASYLQKIHVFKCSADYEAAKALYDDMTNVGEEMAKFRDVVMKKKLPRKQFVQANTIEGENGVEVKEYEGSPLGMIQSFIDRRV